MMMSSSINGSGGRKPFTIKIAKKTADLPPDYYERTWAPLKAFVDAVHEMQHTDFSLELQSDAVKNLVLSKHGATLYTDIRKEIQAHVQKSLDELASTSVQQNPSVFLTAVHAMWTLHWQQQSILSSVFFFMDSKYAHDTPGAQTIREVGVTVFREELLARPIVLNRIVESFLTQVEADRANDLVDAATLSSISGMLTILRLYSSTLEPRVLESTAAFYTAEARQRIADLDVPQYLSYVVDRLRDERERGLTYFDTGNTLRRVMEALNATLISAHAPAILERGFAPLMDARRTVDLKRMYALLSRVNRLEDMRRCLSDYTRKRVGDLVAPRDEEKDKQLIQSVIDFKDEIDRMLFDAFSSNESFQAVVKSSLESGLNSRENKPAELLAKFIDARMRGGTRGTVSSSSAPLSTQRPTAADDSTGVADGTGHDTASDVAPATSSALRGAGAVISSIGTATTNSTTVVPTRNSATAEEEFDRVLDKAMILFRCLHSKDVFEAFYKKDLAKRLLLGKSASTDAEKALVARLKAECGPQFTSKLEGMFKDIEGSASVMTQFRDYIDVSRGGVSSSSSSSSSSPSPALPAVAELLHVHVLTSAYWPTYTPMPQLIIPIDLLPALTAFERFYCSRFSKGRRLQWQHALGHCIVRAVFPLGRKELDVSYFQTLVLLLFNTNESVSFEDIKKQTNMEDSELRRTLQSLACGQVRVLRKEPKGRDVNDADVFHYNAEFKAPLIRLKINTIQLKETPAEVDATNERVFQERQYQIDAAIVRVMKTRKTLAHAALMAEVFSQLRFPAKAADIKRRIESLIERDYLEREENDAQAYRYLV